MAQTSYRGNLSSKVFPFISEWQGQTVLVGGLDQAELNAPQIYYAHNVMPAVNGYQSIGYSTKNIETINTGFKNIFLIQELSGALYYFTILGDGRTFIKNISGGSTWVAVANPGGLAGRLVTSATIQGQTYLFFANAGCYVYDSGTSSLISVTLTGLSIGTILGICASAGYMIAWTRTSIAWSSTLPRTLVTDPIDFVPSLVTGAGGGNVEAAAGPITICIEHSTGFTIYTTQNAIASIYSGNARYPFNLREISGAGGLQDPALVTRNTIGNGHYSYTTNGLQFIESVGARLVFPEITDFLTTKFFEDFDTTTLKFKTQTLTAAMRKAIAFVAERYLVVSYGVTGLTHALVYDTKLGRYGKLKINHSVVFEFGLSVPESIETPRDSIAFLTDTGGMYVVDFAYTAANSNGVLILGKYQALRNRHITMDTVELENVSINKIFEFYIGNSLDGRNISSFTPVKLLQSNSGYAKYGTRATGVNHSLYFLGGFYLTSFELQFHLSGRR